MKKSIKSEAIFKLIVFLLILIGIADSITLSYYHYKNYTDVYFSSFCAISKSINCDTVAQSPWSIFFGLPISTWGLFGYLLLLFLTISSITKKNESTWTYIHLISIVFSLISIILGYISYSKIQSYCLLCIISYLINFLLYFFSFKIIKPTSIQSYLICILSSSKLLYRTKKIFIPLIFLIVLTHIFYPTYWTYSDKIEHLDLPNGIDESGHPWIGAKNPTITIDIYSDYMCFQCSKMNIYLRQLLANNSKEIRLVHHHYPMDHEFNEIVVPEPFHEGSGKMAMIAIYAATKGKFWEMNDALYDLGRNKSPFNTRELANETGFTSGELAAATKHEKIRLLLLRDIQEGMKLNITGTPTFVVNGKTYIGTLPLDKIISP